jgi:hypothetical protein
MAWPSCSVVRQFSDATSDLNVCDERLVAGGYADPPLPNELALIPSNLIENIKIGVLQ